MILRMEDTDKAREVAGATRFIIETLDRFEIKIDEGPTMKGQTAGAYGPYIQSQRRDIYRAFAKTLVEDGKAYPCFATKAELDEIRDDQAQSGARTGYYGPWAIWRNASDAAVSSALRAGLPWVLRLSSDGQHSSKIAFEDCVFGHREMSENDHDIVILKSDGVPTYHFAHVVDDHLMRTTHVIRGDEWLASVPTHLQLFEALGWEAPKYAHVAPINKVDGSSRRKLSKRKDPEASVAFFESEGYLEEATLEYLLSLADSSFEQWRENNVDEPITSFRLLLGSLQAGGGPIFDFDKLDHVSREIVSKLSAGEVFDRGLLWASKFDAEFAEYMAEDPNYSLEALSIERGGEQARKDIRKWSDLRAEVGYFYDGCFQTSADELLEQIHFLDTAEVSDFVSDYLTSYDPSDDRDCWFAKLKRVAIEHEFAERPKDFKRNPDAFKGSIAHAAQVFRVLLTGNQTSPDLFSVMKVMGPDRLRRRLTLGRSV